MPLSDLISEYQRGLPNLNVQGRAAKGYAGNLGQSQVPALWLQFLRQGDKLIQDQYGSQLRAGAESLRSGRQEYERTLTDSYASQGLNPLLGQGVQAESYNRLGEQVSGLQQGLLGEAAESQFNLLGGVTNALTQSYQTERGLALQNYLAAKARATARQQGKSSRLVQLAGLGLSAAGFAFGGPAGAAAGGALAGGLGGGGGGGGQGYQYPYGNDYRGP